jgi:hypothetical protein
VSRGELAVAEVLTFDEMEQQFPDEYAVVVEPEYDSEEQYVRGLVVFHSRDEADARRVFESVRREHPATTYLYTTTFVCTRLLVGWFDDDCMGGP